MIESCTHIHLLEQSAQQDVIDQYNQGKEAIMQMPCLLRNVHSGWPLLQISQSRTQFSRHPELVSVTDSSSYQVAVIKMSFIWQQLVNLLLQLPEYCDATAAQSHVNLIASSLTQNAPNIASLIFEALATNKITSIDSKVIKYHQDVTVMRVSNHVAKVIYRNDTVRSVLNPLFAVVYANEIYIDFGELFDLLSLDKEIKSIFQAIFKVDQFKQMLDSAPAMELRQSIDRARQVYLMLNDLTGSANASWQI